MSSKRGAALLAEEIEHRGITCTKAAEEMRATKGHLSQWLTGRSSPKSAWQAVIEIWSEGRVPRESWLTTDEKRLIAHAKKAAAERVV